MSSPPNIPSAKSLTPFSKSVPTAQANPRDTLFTLLEHAFPSWSHRHALINALVDFVKSPQRFEAGIREEDDE